MPTHHPHKPFRMTYLPEHSTSTHGIRAAKSVHNTTAGCIESRLFSTSRAGCSGVADRYRAGMRLTVTGMAFVAHSTRALRSECTAWSGATRSARLHDGFTGGGDADPPSPLRDPPKLARQYQRDRHVADVSPVMLNREGPPVGQQRISSPFECDGIRPARTASALLPHVFSDRDATLRVAGLRWLFAVLMVRVHGPNSPTDFEAKRRSAIGLRTSDQH